MTIFKNITICYFTFIQLSCETIHQAKAIKESPTQFPVKKIQNLSFEKLLSQFEVVELPLKFDSDSIFQMWDIKPETNLPHGKHLSQNLLKRWLTDNTLIKDDFQNIYPNKIDYDQFGFDPCTMSPVAGFRFKCNDKDILVYYNSYHLGATNGGYWQVWMAIFDPNHILLEMTNIGIHGSFSSGGYYENQEGHGIHESIDKVSSIIDFQENHTYSETVSSYTIHKEFNDKITENRTSNNKVLKLIVRY